MSSALARSIESVLPGGGGRSLAPSMRGGGSPFGDRKRPFGLLGRGREADPQGEAGQSQARERQHAMKFLMTLSPDYCCFDHRPQHRRVERIEQS